MTRDELLDQLRRILAANADMEEGHMQADQALLDFINDDDVSAAFRAIPKWYA